MTMVLRPGGSVDDLVGSATGCCPSCGGPLRLWGHGRWRELRGAEGEPGFRPRRVRCADCGVTQVVLPPDGLVRRRDAIVVVGRAWQDFVAGLGSRRVAHRLGVPMETVRGWLRRLRDLARELERQAKSARHDGLALALAYVIDEARTEGWEEEADMWRFTSYRSQGRLLSNARLSSNARLLSNARLPSNTN